MMNLVNGEWKKGTEFVKVVDPLNKNDNIIEVPRANESEK